MQRVRIDLAVPFGASLDRSDGVRKTRTAARLSHHFRALITVAQGEVSFRLSVSNEDLRLPENVKHVIGNRRHKSLQPRQIAVGRTLRKLVEMRMQLKAK